MFCEMYRNIDPTGPTSIIAGSDGIIVAGEDVAPTVLAHPLGSPFGDPSIPTAIRSDDADGIIALV